MQTFRAPSRLHSLYNDGVSFDSEFVSHLFAHFSYIQFSPLVNTPTQYNFLLLYINPFLASSITSTALFDHDADYAEYFP